MEVLGQGLVLMIAGMGIVYFFLSILIVVTKVSMSGIGRFDSIWHRKVRFDLSEGNAQEGSRGQGGFG